MTARLIVMDIDSTLIDQEVIDLLGEEAGVGEQVAKITERAMRGELDFKQALEERVGLLAGLDESVFERTFERVTFTPGALGACALGAQQGLEGRRGKRRLPRGRRQDRGRRGHRFLPG